MNDDPTYSINVIGDIKQMLKELGTEKGKQTALLGGGGSKAQNERAAALAAILAAKSRAKEDGQSDSNGEVKSQPAYSIVDAASASIQGRSAAAAKASAGDKTTARIALHMAGERAPVNAKMVSFPHIEFEYLKYYKLEVHLPGPMSFADCSTTVNNLAHKRKSLSCHFCA